MFCALAIGSVLPLHMIDSSISLLLHMLTTYLGGLFVPSFGIWHEGGQRDMRLGFSHKAAVLINLYSLNSAGGSEAGEEQEKGMALCCFCLYSRFHIYTSYAVVPQKVMRSISRSALDSSYFVCVTSFIDLLLLFNLFVAVRLHRALTEKLPPLPKSIYLCLCRGSKSSMQTLR